MSATRPERSNILDVMIDHQPFSATDPVTWRHFVFSVEVVASQFKSLCHFDSTGSLFSKLLHGLQIIDPVARGAAPSLGFWSQLTALARRADANVEHLRLVHRRR